MQLAGADAVTLRVRADVQLDELEAVAEPELAVLAAQRVAHLVVPPLPGRAAVAIAEAEQVVVVVEGRDGLERLAPGVPGHIAAPGLQELHRIAHRLPIDGDDVVEPREEVVPAPPHEPHGLSLQPITSRSPATSSTRNRANNSSAYQPSRAVRSTTAACSG